MATVSGNLDTKDFVSVEVSVKTAGPVRMWIGARLLRLASFFLRFQSIRICRGD